MLKAFFPRGLLLAFCALFAGKGISAELAGSADGLQILRKIQGRWQSDCHPGSGAARGSYLQQQLTFSFTHLRIVTTEYSDVGCVSQRAQQSSRFRYIVGGALYVSDGKKVYAIDFDADGDSSPPASLPVSNIIHYSNGELLMGLPSDRRGERPMRLDYSRPFRR